MLQVVLTNFLILQLYTFSRMVKDVLAHLNITSEASTILKPGFEEKAKATISYSKEPW